MRIFLFILMQLAVLVLVSLVGSVVMSVMGIYVDEQSYISLLIMCAIFGCAGSIISLFLSKTMCIHSYKVGLIKTPKTSQEMFLVSTIQALSLKNGLKMPEVGIYQSADPNAFATGYSKDNALVAVSSGLLNSMSEREVAAVLGHELSHIKNGDMVTMTLLQGVLNTFVYFFSYIAAMAISAALNKGSSNNRQSFGSTMLFYSINSFMQMFFGLIANIILMWFSRYREYRADAGSAYLNGKYAMIDALKALERGVQPQPNRERASMQALCINGAAVSELFRSHPPIAKRIAALEALKDA